MWAEDNQSVYTINSGYKVLNKENQMQSIKDFKLLWSLKTTPLALVCVWRVLLDRLLTRANLVKRGMQMGNDCCSLC